METNENQKVIELIETVIDNMRKQVSHENIRILTIINTLMYQCDVLIHNGICKKPEEVRFLMGLKDKLNDVGDAVDALNSYKIRSKRL